MNSMTLIHKMEEVPYIFRNLISVDRPVSFWAMVNFLFPVLASACLIFLLRRILKPRARNSLFVSGILPFFLHLSAVVFMGWEPGIRWLRPESYLFWYLLFLLAVCFLFYRGPAAAKVYLTVTFFAFYLLIIQAMEYTGLGLLQMAKGANLPPDGKQLPALVFYTCPLFRKLPYPDSFFRAAVYNTIFLSVLAGACILMAVSVWYLERKLRERIWNMKQKELVFLLLPAGAGLSFYAFINFIKQLLFETAAVNLAESYGSSVYLLIPVLTLALLAAVLYSCDIYEQLLAFGEEKGKADLLENQVEQMERHIRDVEQLYTGIRSMKHDMQNYLFDIRNLLNARGIRVEDDVDGLGAYFSGIGKALEQLSDSYHTGNPVTDVVINGKWRQAVQQGIEFECSFHFPEDGGISAFDISIILNNALNNALEACERLRKQKPEEKLAVQVESYCRNNMFFVEIINSFDGILLCGRKGNALITRKENSFEHGLGFQNIRQCAEKYMGAAEYRYSPDRFSLTVMLQMERNSRNAD